MPFAASRLRAAPGAAPGALLLCRADPTAVAPVARLLREPMLVVAAGDGWSVLVPEATPWSPEGEPVERVLSGWASALAVAGGWPVLALWWEPDHSGYTLASGFRRPVGYEWLAGGTPLGEDEAMRTFAGRLGLDPVLDVQALDALTKGDVDVDARKRLLGLLAVLERAGVALPGGLTPGESAERLREVALALAGARRTTEPITEGTTEPIGERTTEPIGERAGERKTERITERHGGRHGERRGERKDEPAGERTSESADRDDVPESADRDDVPESADRDDVPQSADRDDVPARAGTGRGLWPHWTRRTEAQTLAVVELAVGLPLAVWGARHRDGGWFTAGALLAAHGALGLSYALARPRD